VENKANQRILKRKQKLKEIVQRYSVLEKDLWYILSRIRKDFGEEILTKLEELILTKLLVKIEDELREIYLKQKERIK